MGRMKLVVGIACICICAVACTDEPEPIIDPGGPFHTLVPGDKLISALDLGEVEVLCDDLIAAQNKFLTEALVDELACRDAGNLAGRVGMSQGAEYQTACQAGYEECLAWQADPDNRYDDCPLPSANCNVTVHALSACLNQIAAATPVSVCVDVPACDGVMPPARPKRSELPPLPGCEALTRDCPDAGIRYSYLCGEG